MMTELDSGRTYTYLLYNSMGVGCLVFQDKANAIQEFMSDAYDGLMFGHSGAELVEGQDQSGVFPDSNPGTFDNQASEERIASLGDASGDLALAAGVFAGDQADITGELVQGPETTECDKFSQEDHGSQCTDTRDGEQRNGVRAIRRFFGKGMDLFSGVSDHQSKILQLLGKYLESTSAAGRLHGELFYPRYKSF
jgi:hypothetical protein